MIIDIIEFKISIKESLVLKSMWKKLIFCVTIIVLVWTIGVIIYLSQFHIDFSQQYRNVKGYETIIFKDSWNEQCFKLCSWGLHLYYQSNINIYA